MQKPRVDAGHLRELVGSRSPAERGEDRPEALVGRNADVVAGIDVPPGRVLPQQRASAELEGANCLAESGLEAAVNRHHLARGLHLRARPALAERELVK